MRRSTAFLLLSRMTEIEVVAARVVKVVVENLLRNQIRAIAIRLAQVAERIVPPLITLRIAIRLAQVAERIVPPLIKVAQTQILAAETLRTTQKKAAQETAQPQTKKLWTPKLRQMQKLKQMQKLPQTDVMFKQLSQKQR